MFERRPWAPLRAEANQPACLGRRQRDVADEWCVPMSKRPQAPNLPAAPPERQTKTIAKNGTREHDIETTSAHVGRASTFRSYDRAQEQRSTDSVQRPGVWISSRHPSSQRRAHSSHPGTPALQRRHHYHRERPWRCADPHDMRTPERSTQRNDGAGIRDGRLTAWHCLYDNGSTREGVGTRACGKTSVSATSSCLYKHYSL
jgi:hypothetical protein